VPLGNWTEPRRKGKTGGPLIWILNCRFGKQVSSKGEKGNSLHKIPMENRI